MVKHVLRVIQTSIHIRIGRGLTPAAVLATALLISACGSSGSHSAKPAMSMSMSMSHAASTQHAMPTSAIVRSGHAAVQISNYAFAPARITVKAGTRITWTNHDKTAHTATANNMSFDTGTIAPKASKTVDFKRPGVYKYHCVFHAFMTATSSSSPDTSWRRGRASAGVHATVDRDHLVGDVAVAQHRQRQVGDLVRGPQASDRDPRRISSGSPGSIPVSAISAGANALTVTPEAASCAERKCVSPCSPDLADA